MTDATLLGPLGALRAIPFVQAGTVVERARPGSEFTTLDGRRHIQRAPRANRTWQINLGQWRNPADLAYLTACADGSIPGPLYLYREDAAATNLLPADIASPGGMGVTALTYGGVEPPSGTVPALVQGALVPIVGVHNGWATAGDWSYTIPLPLGSYRLSGWASSAGALVGWRTVNALGAQVSTGNLSAAASSSGGFRGEGTVAVSGAAVGVQIRLPANTDSARRVGGFRLTAGAAAQVGGWVSGRGVPQVVVDDPGEVLQYASAGEVRADYTVTLREVG